VKRLFCPDLPLIFAERVWLFFLVGDDFMRFRKNCRCLVVFFRNNFSRFELIFVNLKNCGEKSFETPVVQKRRHLEKRQLFRKRILEFRFHALQNDFPEVEIVDVFIENILRLKFDEIFCTIRCDAHFLQMA